MVSLAEEICTQSAFYYRIYRLQLYTHETNIRIISLNIRLVRLVIFSLD